MSRTALFIAVLLGCFFAASAEEPQPLVFVKSISLEQLEGRLDHMAVDAAKKRLYVSALTNDSIEVVDLALGKHVRSLTGPKGPQGLAILPESHEVVVTSGEDGVCRLYDETLNLVRILNGMPNADNVRYDASSKHIYLGYGKALAVIDPAGPTKISETALDEHPESFQVEKEGSHIYVNLPETRQVVVIDKSSGEITSNWQLLEARDAFPMALDEKQHRLFVGCRRPSKVLIYDTTYGSYIGKVDCVADADDIYYDTARKLIYVTGGQGYITVIAEKDPYLYKVVANISSTSGARTSCFEPESGTLYLAVPHRRKQPAQIWVYQARP